MKKNLISVPEAVALLDAGEVVGIPTETVYGLAARIDRPDAIRRIFTTKERPFFDPLIVHVSSIDQARALVTDWSEAAQCLAEAFWPGPLTLVLPKSPAVNPMITSGLEHVGLRMPRHPLALEVIAKSECPLAAPSANRFGRTSPSKAEHVLLEFGQSVPVIDGGPCQIGIESTVLKLDTEDGEALLGLLRPGLLTLEDLTQALARKNLKFQIAARIEAASAPGQMKHHYMPEIPLIWVDDPMKSPQDLEEELHRRIQELPSEIEGVKIKKPQKKLSRGADLDLPEEPALAARELYSRLREKSESGADHLIYRHRPERNSPEWEGVLDRLRKAAHLIIK